MRIAALTSEDRAAWEILARGYRAFYKTPTSDEEFETAWSRLLRQDGILGLGAKVDGRLVGIAHYLFHTSTWTPKVCYLQDLFTAPEARGQGVGRALIEAIAQEARNQRATRYYLHTQSHNAVARGLYDKAGQHKDFLRYELNL
jgi:GNAT superfamily N-acetyltransferase